MNNYITYCTHCGTDVVICGKCGNNCCNGGYGEIFTEVPGVMKVCDQCPSAYLMQDEQYKTISKQSRRNHERM